VHTIACTRLDDGTPVAVTGVGHPGAGAGGEVIVWDLRTGQQRTTLTGQTWPMHTIACTRLDDGTPVGVTGGAEVIVWDLRTGQQRTTLTGHAQPVYAVACTRLDDGTPVAVTGGGDWAAGGEVIVWDLRTGQMQQTFAEPYPVRAISCDSDRGVVIGMATEIVRLQYGP
jgi:WD40 repeat protein